MPCGTLLYDVKICLYTGSIETRVNKCGGRPVSVGIASGYGTAAVVFPEPEVPGAEVALAS